MDEQSDLGVLLRAAHGLDRAWWDQARCNQWEPPDDSDPLLGPWRDRRYVGPSIWQVDTLQTIRWEGHPPIKGAKLIDLAVLVCSACPAQWDCITYAVKGQMQAGTWGTTPKNLAWLLSIGTTAALEVIEDARAGEVPVHDAVREARFGRRVSCAS